MRINKNKGGENVFPIVSRLTRHLLAFAKPFAPIADRVILDRKELRAPTAILKQFFLGLTDSTPLHQESWRTLGEAVEQAKAYIDSGRQVAVVIHRVSEEGIVALKLIVRMPDADGEQGLFAEFAAIEIKQLRNFNS